MTKAWKAMEKETAKRLGGKRVGITGLETPDVVTDWCVAECKERERLPKWVVDAMNSICAKAGDKLPILILHQLHSHRDNDLVVMKMKDWEEWHGRK
jgi:hypothetical protein